MKRDGMRRAGLAALGLALACCVQAGAQATCAKGNEWVFFGAGGFPPGPPPAPGSVAPAPPGIYEGCLDVKSGQLTLLGMKAAVDHASWVTVDPKHSMLYTTGSTKPGLRFGDAVLGFAIDRNTGALEPRGIISSGGSDPTDLVQDPKSGLLFVANHAEGIIGVVKTGRDGAVTTLSDKAQEEGSGPTPRQKNAAAHGVAVSPSGKYLLTADFGSDKVYVYHLDAAAGKLTPGTPPFLVPGPGTGPRHIRFTPDGKYVLLDTELNGQIRVYRWNEAEGTLEQTQVVDPFTADYKGSRSAGEMQVSKDGRFVYLTLRGKVDKLITYRREGGQLTEVDRTGTGNTPWSFGLDATGKWLLVTNSAGNTVQVYAVDPATGKPTAQGEPVPLIAGMTVAFLPH